MKENLPQSVQAALETIVVGTIHQEVDNELTGIYAQLESLNLSLNIQNTPQLSDKLLAKSDQNIGNKFQAATISSTPRATAKRYSVLQKPESTIKESFVTQMTGDQSNQAKRSTIVQNYRNSFLSSLNQSQKKASTKIEPSSKIDTLTQSYSFLKKPSKVSGKLEDPLSVSFSK